MNSSLSLCNLCHLLVCFFLSLIKRSCPSCRGTDDATCVAFIMAPGPSCRGNDDGSCSCCQAHQAKTKNRKVVQKTVDKIATTYSDCDRDLFLQLISKQVPVIQNELQGEVSYVRQVQIGKLAATYIRMKQSGVYDNVIAFIDRLIQNHLKDKEPGAIGTTCF